MSNDKIKNEMILKRQQSDEQRAKYIRTTCMKQCENAKNRDICYRNCVDFESIFRDPSYLQCLLSNRINNHHCLPNFFGVTVSKDAKFGDIPKGL